MRPQITIITPVYNGEATLKQCVASVLDQSLEDWELILIDDGSLDASGSLCDGFAREDSRICVIHQENQGVSAARNAGLDRVRGEFVTFLDCDDTLAPDYLQRMLQHQRETQADVVITGASAHTADGREFIIEAGITGVFGKEIWQQICRSSAPFGYAGGKLIREDLLCQPPIRFRRELYSQEDLDFYLSVYHRCASVALVKPAGYRYWYQESKRVPPVFDFLANQMKLYRLACSHVLLEEAAEKALTQRVELLIYCALYEQKDLASVRSWVERMEQVEGLTDFLEDHRTQSARGRIAQWARRGCCRRIAGYFALRKGVKGLLPGRR